MEMNFCRRCGSKLEKVNGHVFKCQNGHILFANSSPAVAVWLVNEKNEVLIATRGIEPGMGLLDAPGGFIDGDSETFEQALEREVAEEVGITRDQYDTPQYLTSSIDNYNYKDETIPVLSCIYWARVKNGVECTPMDDVASVAFTPINEIDLEKVYFVSAKESLEILKNLL